MVTSYYSDFFRACTEIRQPPMSRIARIVEVTSRYVRHFTMVLIHDGQVLKINLLVLYIARQDVETSPTTGIPSPVAHVSNEVSTVGHPCLDFDDVISNVLIVCGGLI